MTSTTSSPSTSTPEETTSSAADRLRALATEQLARDGWSRDRLLDHQGERLAALIAHAVAASPYYREALGRDAAPLHISNQVYAALLAGRPNAAPRLTVTTPLPEMVAALNAFQPEALTAYPSVAAALAEEQLQGRLRISPGLVATSSEVQTADMRRRMAAAWG